MEGHIQRTVDPATGSFSPALHLQVLCRAMHCSHARLAASSPAHLSTLRVRSTLPGDVHTTPSMCYGQVTNVVDSMMMVPTGGFNKFLGRAYDLPQGETIMSTFGDPFGAQLQSGAT
jgi:hypothetical protein